MTRRRLRLPELIALLAVTTPVLATQPDAGATTPSVADSAKQLGASVKRSSAELGHRVASGAREAGQSMHKWWDGVRGTGAQSQASAPPNSTASKTAALQSTSSLTGGTTHTTKSQSSIATTGQSWP